MSYIDLLDRKKSIQAARHEMEHFSDLYRLHEFKTIPMELAVQAMILL